MIAHIVNNRANAAVPKRKAASISSDDDENDLSAIFAKRQKEVPKRVQPAPVPSNVKNLWDGPLPFEKLNFKTSLSKKSEIRQPMETDEFEVEDEDDLAGGFQHDDDVKVPKPLPPWMIRTGDIRADVQEQRARDLELNAEDRERALDEEMIYRRGHGIIEVQSSDEESDIEVVDARPAERMEIDLTKESLPATQEEPHSNGIESAGDLMENIRAIPTQSNTSQDRQSSPRPLSTLHAIGEERERSPEEFIEWSESDQEDAPTRSLRDKEPNQSIEGPVQTRSSITKSQSPQPNTPAATLQSAENGWGVSQLNSPSPVFENIEMPTSTAFPTTQEAEPFISVLDRPLDIQEADMGSDIGDFDEFSDPEDQELLAQLAMEAEEHARFASTLNNKSAEENREAYERELKALRNQQKKDRRDADEVSHVMITECQALLRLFGLPYITAPMEAEAQCAELVHLGLVDGIVTDDSDIFLFGGTRVYKNMFNSNKFVECYLAKDIEKELSLSRYQLISIAHLLGSDYTEGLPGIGPVTALEIVSEFCSSETGLQEFRDWWSDVQQNSRPKEADAASPFRRKFRRAQATKLFLPPGFPSSAVTDAYLNPQVDHSPEPFQWGVPDLDALRQFFMATIGWSQERTDEVLVPVIRDMNRREAEGTQSNITRYFEGGVGVGAQERGDAFAPRVREKESVRMREAVKKLKSKAKAKTGGGLSTKGTFADEAVSWVEKDKKRVERERKRVGTSGGEGKTKGAKKVVCDDMDLNVNVDANDGAGDAHETDADVDAAGDASQAEEGFGTNVGGDSAKADNESKREEGDNDDAYTTNRGKKKGKVMTRTKA
jgi:DNA excision repair protein ERCC-5